MKTIAIALALTIGLTATALAQAQPTADDITRALQQRGVGVRGLPQRGVTAEPSTESPRIDLYITFKYNSAEVEPEAMQTLRALGTALKSDELARARIEVIGHTDAKGHDDYNLKLSDRRANAVRTLLVGMFDIDAARLVAIGKGKRELKDPARPEDGINRRVEVRNVGTN